MSKPWGWKKTHVHLRTEIHKQKQGENIDAGKILLFDMSHSFLDLMNRTKCMRTQAAWLIQERPMDRTRKPTIDTYILT
jgi:hypothetical protein